MDIISSIVRRFMAEEKTRRYTAKCRACGAFTSGVSFGNEMQKRKVDKGPFPRKGDVYTSDMGDHVMDCRKCGQPARAKPIRGKFNPTVVCNAKCQASTGFNCECSCAGKNHGATFEG
jgi:hypothetical protein